MSKEFRKLQFEDEQGHKRIINHEEAKKIAKRIITSKMISAAFIAGIAVVADGGKYTLLGAEKYLKSFQ